MFKFKIEVEKKQQNRTKNNLTHDDSVWILCALSALEEHKAQDEKDDERDAYGKNDCDESRKKTTQINQTSDSI